MAKLPYTRVVSVTLTRNDRFAATSSFGTPLILTTEAGGASATTRTVTYATIDEVEADYATSTSTYLAAQTMFNQNPHPLQIKVGFIAAGSLTTAATMSSEMTALYEADSDFYVIVPTAEFRDLTDPLDALISWVQGHKVQLFIDSNDDAIETVPDTTSVAGRNKNANFTRTAVFYSREADEYLSAAVAAYVSRRNFDLNTTQAQSAYTVKFKTMTGITPIDAPSGTITAITGFVPEVGLSATSGNYANCYINLGGVNFVVEGNHLAGGFIDETHMGDWITSRTEEEILNTFLKNDRIAYDDQGVALLVAAVDGVMSRADAAGLVAQDLDAQTGDYSPSYQISVPRVSTVPESQRRQRIAPLISCQFRQAGAIHYSSVTYSVTV